MASFNLFKEVSSHCGDFIAITRSDEFPLELCQVRWTENSKVARRLQEVLPYLIKYVEHVKNRRQQPSCNSFATVAAVITDKLLSAKLAFFWIPDRRFRAILKRVPVGWSIGTLFTRQSNTDGKVLYDVFCQRRSNGEYEIASHRCDAKNRQPLR